MAYTVDPSRATFVRNEFRYDVRSDTTVKARFPAAVERVIETQLDAASAATVAQAYFAEFSRASAVYSIEYQAQFKLSDLAGSVPRFVLDDPAFPALAGKDMRTVRVQTDAALERTEVQVRG